VETVGGHVWSVDPDRAHVPPHWFDSDLWTFVQADDLAVVDEAPACDLLFVDTTHSFDQTRSELAAYVWKVRPGGVILLHDTELERPEAAPHDEPFPVRRAIEEFLPNFPAAHVEWVPGCNGLAVIRLDGED
jgi:predicted O-methyltransferase YrrM